MARCERPRCRHEALTGSRWCKGHQYIGEGFVEPQDRDVVAKPSAPERRSLLDVVKRILGE